MKPMSLPRTSCVLLASLAAGCGFADAPPLVELAAVPSPAGPGSGEPNLAAGPDGVVYLSWIEPTADGGHALRLSVRRGDAWSEPTTIASGADLVVNWADFPSVAVLPDGTLAAHWLVREGERSHGYGIRIARSTDGGATWSAPVVPHRHRGGPEYGFVSLFPGSPGHLAAVWLDSRASAGSDAHGGAMQLRLTTLGPNGTLGRDIALDARTCDCCQTAAALTADGPIVVYRDRSTEEVRDIFITRNVDGGWTEPRPVHRDGWVVPACPVNGPAVSASDRRVAVAWFTAAADTPRVRVAFSDDAGASFGEPVRVDDGDPAGRVDVELLPDGAALVSWLERTGQGAEVRVRRVEREGAIGARLTVAASSAERASGFPRMLRAGNAIYFTWTEPGAPARVRVASATLAGAT